MLVALFVTLLVDCSASLQDNPFFEIKTDKLKSAIFSGGFYQQIHISIPEINEQFMLGVRKSLLSFEKYLNRIKTKAQDLQASSNPIPSYDDVKYLDRADESNLVKLVPRYSNVTKINLTNSFVQVPVELYNRNKQLLEECLWSKGLDELFKKQLEVETSLVWQYVGFITGASRMYPGTHLQKL